MHPSDPLKNILYVDLTEKEFWVEEKPELFQNYLGGTGVAIKLLLEECPQGCDPLSKDNPIILAVGPLTGLYPFASKTVAMFKSPHTGNLGESHCGGRNAIALRMAGYGAVVIKGASETPIYLAIHGDKVYFRDASALWGMQNSFTVGRIIRENEPNAGFRSIMRIGGAGEKLVSYACVTSETYRHFGRLGLGAVFGSKKLKAIVISGRRSLPIKDKREYCRLYDEIYHKAIESEVMKKYHDLGTAENIMPLNKLGALPTRNLLYSQLEDAEGISGETLASQYLGRRLACSHCPIGCIHIAALREPYEDEAYFYKTTMISYDYELIYSLGSMLGVSNAHDLLRLIDKVETYAMDAMSTGVTLAWATEAQRQGLISERETNGLKLEWGEAEEYIKAIDLIIKQPNEFYQALARGVEYASTKYGGGEYALSFGGNEMPGYHTGPAAHIGFLIGARHSHLDNAGYSIDQKTLIEKQLSPEELVEKLIEEESWRQILSSLVVCFFARGVYQPRVVEETLRVTGFNIDDPKKLGREILEEKYRFKTREGFNLRNLSIPKRILETSSAIGEIDGEYIRRSIEYAEETLIGVKG